MAGKEAYFDRIPQRDIGEKCAVFGVFDTSGHLETSRIVFRGLHALQHRGQEGSGISASDGEKLYTHKRRGLVLQVYDDEDPSVFSFGDLPGNKAIGHNRYGTFTRRAYDHHLQPVTTEHPTLTLAHNGNLPDTTMLQEFLDLRGIDASQLNDSEMMHAAILNYKKRGANLEEAVRASIPLFKGAFSFLAMDNKQILAARDEKGLRPFSIGRLNGGYIFSSETCALDVIGANFIRDINPGEIVIANENGFRSIEFAKGEQKLDIFEFIYFAKPDSRLLGKSVYEVRKELGKMAARVQSHADSDIVIDIPDSSTPYAIGFSQQSKIPFDQGLIKNRYTGRTFQRPDQAARKNEILGKLNPVRDVLLNKRVIVVDDSLVRGNVSKAVVKMLRDAGAREVHMRIASPPVKFPDFYGIDTPSQSELIGANKSIEEIGEEIGADSLEFLRYEHMIEAIGIDEEMLSTSCFTGEYPLDIGKRKEEIVYQT